MRQVPFTIALTFFSLIGFSYAGPVRRHLLLRRRVRRRFNIGASILGNNASMLRTNDKSTLIPNNKSTLQPTNKPTLRPSTTSQPSISPEGTPESVLSTAPSSKPTINASSQLSRHSTSQPTIGQDPSTIGTSEPTFQSSIEPSSAFTTSPSEITSYYSSPKVSNWPSVVPTHISSNFHPTLDSSKQPSFVPSMNDLPSTRPSSGATSSMKPSSLPSLEPSDDLEKSGRPSPYPSMNHSKSPTTLQSGIASANPTVEPSFIQSSDPSVQRRPSLSPSENVPRFPSELPPNYNDNGSHSPTNYPSSTKSRGVNDNSSSSSPSNGPTPVSTLVDPAIVFQEEEENDEERVAIYLIGGLGTGLGLIGMVTMIVLLFRRRRDNESHMENNTINSDATVSSSPPAPPTSAAGNPVSSRDDQTHSGVSLFTFSATEENVSRDSNALCNFSYSEESSVFQGLAMSLSHSSVGSGDVSKDVSKYSFSEINVNKLTSRHAGKVANRSDNLPIQQLCDQSMGPPAENFKNAPKNSENISSSDESMVSILQTEVLQPSQTSLVRLLSCFSSTSLLNDTTIKKRRGEDKIVPVQSISRNTTDSGKTSDVISVVSSLSGKSSCTDATIDFTCGEPYEVLVSGKDSLGLVVKSTKMGPQVVHTKETSPLYQVVDEGDYILSVDGVDTRHVSAKALSKWLHKTDAKAERTIILMGKKTTYHEFGKSFI